MHSGIAWKSLEERPDFTRKLAAPEKSTLVVGTGVNLPAARSPKMIA